MASVLTLDKPLTKGVRLPADREASRLDPSSLLPGLRLVSADNHWDVADDVFFERFPDRLKDQAPRVRFSDGLHKMGRVRPDGSFDGGVLDADGVISRVVKVSAGLAGSHDLAARVAHMDIEGISAEINFPQFVAGFVHYPDFEVRELIFRIYNEYIVERAAFAPGRMNGVGVLSNWWDPEKAEAAVRQIVDLGLKTFMVPITPGKDREGREILYSEPNCDRLWRAIEAGGLPVCFHVGENPSAMGRGGWGINATHQNLAFFKPFSQLVFGAVFDRCPALRVVFAEGGLIWVPTALHEIGAIYDNFREIHDPLPKMRPSEYWRAHCYATFQYDPIGLQLLEHIGADRVMWAVDYPHCEGTFGYTRNAVQAVLDRVPAVQARDILGGTAARLFGI
jgi:predicted TIM-barrel fold metal-dependent hydrolase